MGSALPARKNFPKVFSDSDIEALKIMSRETIGWKIELKRKRPINQYDNSGKPIRRINLAPIP